MLINRLSRLMGDKRVNIADVTRGSSISYSTIHDLYHDNRKRIDFRVLNALCSYFAVGPWRGQHSPTKERAMGGAADGGLQAQWTAGPSLRL